MRRHRRVEASALSLEQSRWVREAGDDFVLDGGAAVDVAVGKGGLGQGAQGRPRLIQNAAKFDELVPKRGDDGHYMVTPAMVKCANHDQ